MTIVAAVRWHGVTYIGSDSQTMNPDTLMTYAATKRKWIIGDGCALGISGNGIIGDVMRRSASKILEDRPPIDEIVSRARTALQDWKLERQMGFGMVATNTTGVYVICGDWDVVPIRDGCLGAVGSGCEFAVGGYHGAWNTWSQGRRPDPDVCLRTAIEAAILYNAGCGGDIFIHSIRAKLGDDDGIRSQDSVSYPCREEGVAPLWDRDQRRRVNGFGETDMGREGSLDQGSAGLEI